MGKRRKRSQVYIGCINTCVSGEKCRYQHVATGAIDTTFICDEDRISPAMWSRTSEFNLEIDLEPIRGLKIRLTNNRTDSHTDRIQFMYDDMPVARKSLPALGLSFMKPPIG